MYQFTFSSTVFKTAVPSRVCEHGIVPLRNLFFFLPILWAKVMSYFFIVTVVEFFFMPIGYMCVCELLMSSVRFLLPLETYMLMVNSYNGSELINKILPHNLHLELILAEWKSL